MIAKTFLILTLTTLISGCSILGRFHEEKPIEIITKPIQIEIIQPVLPRELNLEAPKWYVVSEAKIANPCKAIPKLDETGNPILNEDGTQQTSRPKVCNQEDRENPELPEGYTYFDKFIDDIKTINGGDVLFVAMSIKDYELMSANIQELRRYIRELGEVIVYYREVTTKKIDQENETKE
jgi:hypothetical protein